MDVLPSIPQDTTDRNRTSPLAFTGNKFEFRMVGSSQSVAGPNIILNTIMAESLSGFADILEKAEDFDGALQSLVSQTLKDHQRIIFNGNGYAKEWTSEAEKRGLYNLSSTADALCVYRSQKNIDLVIRHKIFTEEEFRARYEIYMNAYRKVISIEGKTMVSMVMRQILPASMAYCKSLCDSVNAKAPLGACHSAESDLINKLSSATDMLYKNCLKLQNSLSGIPDNTEDSVRYCTDVIVAEMEAVRDEADRLEALTAKSYWPYPTYSDLLFY